MIDTRKKIGTAAAVVSLCAAVGVVGLIGCAPQAATPAASTGGSDAPAASESDYETMEKWGELYPLQYGSYAVTDIKSDGQRHSHYDLKQKMLAPADRFLRDDGQLHTRLLSDGEVGYNDDGNITISGMWYDSENHHWVVDEDVFGDLSGTRERMGCYSCKSSVFNDIYERDGAEIFGEKLTDEFVDEINGQVWDCGTCHDGDPATSAPDAQLPLWSQLSREAFDSFDAKERVCGQCHNSLDYRSHITDQQTMDSFNPYKYGTDIDSLHKAVVEDGVYSIDEDTGILMTCFDHPDLEILQGSAMRELGVTCVDCHMASTTDAESGAAFTSHNASGSPLENEDALEYCLTCHKSQGINTTSEMVKMVRDLQDETTVKLEALGDKFDQAYEAVKQANQSGGVDEGVLQKARDDYSIAYSYYYAICGDVGDEPLGTKVVHNPAGIADYANKAESLIDGVIAALA